MEPRHLNAENAEDAEQGLALRELRTFLRLQYGGSRRIPPLTTGLIANCEDRSRARLHLTESAPLAQLGGGGEVFGGFGVAVEEEEGFGVVFADVGDEEGEADGFGEGGERLLGTTAARESDAETRACASAGISATCALLWIKAR